MDHEVIFYDASSVEVRDILLADKIGIVTSRLILFFFLWAFALLSKKKCNFLLLLNA
jgi:hypothetical protein